MAPINEIGFSALPEHLNRRSAKKGFEFTLMVVGETGLGKSTLMSCLFGSDLGKTRRAAPPPPLTQESMKKTLTIEKSQLDIVEKSLKLRVTIIDTPGYGDGLNTESGLVAIDSYIKSQYEEFFREESGINRKSLIGKFLDPKSSKLNPKSSMLDLYRQSGPLLFVFYLSHGPRLDPA